MTEEGTIIVESPTSSPPTTLVVGRPVNRIALFKASKSWRKRMMMTGGTSSSPLPTNVRDITSHKEVEKRFRSQVSRTSTVKLVTSPGRSPGSQRESLFSVKDEDDEDIKTSIERLTSLIPDSMIPDDEFAFKVVGKVASDVKREQQVGSSFEVGLRVVENFVEEATNEYRKGVKSGIIRYVLTSKEERQRLGLPVTCQVGQQTILIRAPLPWHESVIRAKTDMERHFTYLYPLLEQIRSHWFTSGMADLDVLDKITFPSDVTYFYSRVSINCQVILTKLTFEWVSAVADMYNRFEKEFFPHSQHHNLYRLQHPSNNHERVHKVNGKRKSSRTRKLSSRVDDGKDGWKTRKVLEEVREVIATFMGRLLRKLVMDNIEEWVAEANNVDDRRNEREVFLAKANMSDLVSESISCQLEPNPADWPLLLLHPIKKLLEVTKCIPRIEKYLTVLPDDDFDGKSAEVILAVRDDDWQIVKFEAELVHLVSEEDSHRLLEEINDKVSILDKFRKRRDNERHDLEQVRNLISDLESFEGQFLKDDNHDNRTSGVMLVNYGVLEKKMYRETRQLKNAIIKEKVTEIVNLAKNVCDKLEEIKSQVDNVADTTEDLMATVRHVNNLRLLVKVIFVDIEYIQDHWTFLVQEGAVVMSDTHFELLHTLYNWPDAIRSSFAESDNRLGQFKKKKEARLRERISNFESTLNEILNDILTFKKKKLSSPLEKSSDNVKYLQHLDLLIEEAQIEKAAINFEEGLLGWHQASSFPVLDQILLLKYPLDLLWLTAQEFERKQRAWMTMRIHEIDLSSIKVSLTRMKKKINDIKEAIWEAERFQVGQDEGPEVVSDLHDEDIRENVDVMETRIVGFETVQVPLLTVLSMPVLKEKHIKQLGSILNRKINLTAHTTLTEVAADASINLSEVAKIEHVGKIASREHALEMFLLKMKNEWISDEWPEDALEVAANKFLEEENLETSVKEECVKAFKFIHEESRKYISLNEKFLPTCVRVTPPAFIELMLTFKSLLKKKSNFILSRSVRFRGGVESLELAASFVSSMKKTLIEVDRPRLEVTSRETERLMIQIEEETIDVEWTKERIASDEGLANRAAALAQQIRDECTKELVEAVPAMESAAKALDTLVPEDIVFLRTMKNPPLGLKMVLESVAILLGFEPDRRMDLNGYMTNNYWAAAMRMLNSSEVRLLDSLKAYDKDRVDQPSMKIVRENYLIYEDFDPLALRNVSKASESLAKWVKAVDIYDRVINVIKPKKAKLLEAEAELARLVDSVYTKKTELQIITDRLQTLSDNFASISKEKKDLEESILLASQKVDRAEKLLQGLEGEKDRWREYLESQKDQEDCLIGDTILASAFIVYLSGMDSDRREECLSRWKHFLMTNTIIKFTYPYNFVRAASESELDVQTWIVAGLPTETFHLENATILHNSLRYCLAIDPTQLVSDFLRKLYMSKSMMIVSEEDELSDGVLLQIRKNITRGRPILIQDVDLEKLKHHFIQAILIKEIEDSGVGGDFGSSFYLKLGEEEVAMSPDFNLFLTRKDMLKNMPKNVYSRICVINWMDTKYDNRERKENIQEALRIKERAKKEKQLLELENKLLELLSSREVDALEDERAIRILVNYKTLATELSSPVEPKITPSMGRTLSVVT